MSSSTEIMLNATTRNETGKNVARRLRAAGHVPATVYGGGEGPASSTVARRELAALIRHHGRSRIISLNFDGHLVPVKIAKLQLDPVRETVIHADFIRVVMTEQTNFTVPLQIKGEPDGVKNAGGVLDVVLHELEIRCLPGELPESISADVSGLGVGDHLSVGDLKIGDGIEVVTDASAVIATVVLPAGEVASSAETAAEPEVIRKGKGEQQA